MKLFRCRSYRPSVAGIQLQRSKTTTPVRQNQRDTMILRNITTRRLISIIWRPAMINLTNLACRTTSSTTCDAITRILVYSPVSGAFFTRAPCQAAPETQTENVDIEPGHDQRRPGELQSAQRLPQQQRSAGHPHYRHQQRQRRHPPGFIAPQQRAPDTIADEGGDKRQVAAREPSAYRSGVDSPA